MKPILFNTDMARAILDGRKTATRRLIKPQPIKQDGGQYLILPKKPFQTGEILYVRETWTVEDVEQEEDKWIAYIGYKAEGNTQFGCQTKIIIKENEVEKYNNYLYNEVNYRPSIHMPKEAARIFLKVVTIKAMRLQDMEHDAPLKEGIRSYTKDEIIYKFAPSDEWMSWRDMPENPTKAFELLWNSTINKSDLNQHGWEANPWVWVIEFERITKEERCNL